MYDMRAGEALLIAFPKMIKSLATSHLIWKALENSFKGDEHFKKLRLQSWICAFQDAKMMEDEFVRTYVRRISKVTIGIRSQGGTKEDDEVMWKILKSLMLPFK